MLTIILDALCAGRSGEILAGPLDLALHEGEALIVTGENGAGKSTLLRTLAGLLPPVSGGARVEGALAPDGEPVRRLSEVAHYLGHRNAMKAGETLLANLAFWHRFLGGARGESRAAAAAAMEAVALGDLSDLALSHLSAGQQRRAAFARLLVIPRPVWILDEPVAALDAASQGRFAEIGRRHLKGGGILVAATHQPLGLSAREFVLERRAAAADAGPELWA